MVDTFKFYSYEASISFFLNSVFIYYYIYHLAGVDHSAFNTSLMIPRVGCTDSQALFWSELTARSLFSTAPIPKIRCNAIIISAMYAIFLGLLWFELETTCTRLMDFIRYSEEAIQQVGRSQHYLNIMWTCQPNMVYQIQIWTDWMDNIPQAILSSNCQILFKITYILRLKGNGVMYECGWTSS